MTVRELIAKLREFPPESEVWMEVRGHEGFATDVDWESGGISSWAKITDYPVEEERESS